MSLSSGQHGHPLETPGHWVYLQICHCGECASSSISVMLMLEDFSSILGDTVFYSLARASCLLSAPHRASTIFRWRWG